MNFFLLLYSFAILGLVSCSEIKPLKKNSGSPNWIKIQGNLSNSEVRDELQKFQADLQGCYESKLILEPDLSGRFIIQWSVDERGRTRNIKVAQSEIKDQSLFTCLRSVIRKMSFSPSKESEKVIISYPFELVSEKL